MRVLRKWNWTLPALLVFIAWSEPVFANPWDPLSTGVVIKAKAKRTASGEMRIKKARVTEGRIDRADITAPWEGFALGKVVLLGAPFTAVDSILPGLGNLAGGEWIEADLELVEAGVWRIYRLKAAAQDTRHEIEVEGPLDALSAKGRGTLAGVPIRFSRSAVIEGTDPLDASLENLFFAEVDDDDAVLSGLRFAAGRVAIGGALRADFEPEQNFNLNPNRPGDLRRSRWAAEFQLEAIPASRHRVFLKFGSRSTVIHLDEQNSAANSTDWQLQQAFWLWSPGAAPELAIQVGRQDFDEAREWIYDENLDAVRLHWRNAGTRLEASVSSRWKSASTHLDDWTNSILYMEREVRDRWSVGAFGIRRVFDSDAPTWIGVRSYGRLSSRLRHWTELSSLSGELDGVSRSAYAIDIGLGCRLSRRGHTEVTVGWARGSGGEVKETYRQTGLNDNSSRFGGVTSFKYYGELVEPELSNLDVLTIGAGFRPTQSTSLDLVYHALDQVSPSRAEFRSGLDSRPLGIDPDIGTEWNMIVGFKEFRQVDIEYDFAYFMPGRAFPESADAATVHRLKMRFKF